MLEGEKTYIKKAKRGNKEAFGFLYNHYLPQIYRFILFKINNQKEAEDLTHGVFLSAWQNVRNYEYEGFPFSSWLYQIAKNAVIDFYRTSKKNISVEDIDENALKIDAEDPVKIDASLEIEKLKKNISLLKSDYQDIIIMRFIEDMTHEEIANILNKSEGAIRLLQHRALKELKSIYYDNES
jgi:RNA polymerase sigma-70 factor (ECF subfamily)